MEWMYMNEQDMLNFLDSVGQVDLVQFSMVYDICDAEEDEDDDGFGCEVEYFEPDNLGDERFNDLMDEIKEYYSIVEMEYEDNCLYIYCLQDDNTTNLTDKIIDKLLARRSK